MKKNVVRCMAGLFFVSTVAIAQPTTCGFSDHIRVQGPSGTGIRYFEVSNFSGTEVSGSEFILADNGQCANGESTVIVGTDEAHSSTVKLSDGPWKLVHIESNTSAGGFDYVGLQQISRHEYILFFNQS